MDANKKEPGEMFLWDFPYDAEPDSPEVLQLWTPEDIYAKADKTTFEKFKEDRRIERKSPLIHVEHLAEYFSMWANSPGGGLIAVGVNDKTGKVEGCRSLDMAVLNKL